MDTINSRDTLKNLLENGVTEEGVKKLFDIFSQSDFSRLNKDEQLDLYNLISLVELKIINIPSLLVQMTIAKANLLNACIISIEDSTCAESSCSGCEANFHEGIKKSREELPQGDDDDIYLMKTDAGEILKYYTKENSGINPPADGDIGTVRINNFNRFGKKFLATVQIDSTGKVVHVVDEPELEDCTPLDFDTLYTNLAHEVLKFSE